MPNSSAAEAADGVGVAHRVLDEAGHLSEHAVARAVAALVVHGLEAVEVEVAQHVARPARRAPPRALAEGCSNSRRFTRPVSASWLAW